MDPLLEKLKQDGIVTEKQALDIETSVEKTRSQDPVYKIVISRGYASESQVMKALAEQYSIPYVELSHKKISTDILYSIPPDLIKKYRIIPVSVDTHSITIAISNPLDLTTLDALRIVVRKAIKSVVASESDIENAIATYFTHGVREQSIDSVIEEFETGLEGSGTTVEAVDRDFQTEELQDDDAPVIKLVSLLILEAFRARASDIHIEPFEKSFRVRYRIDGVLHEVPSPPKRLQGSILSRLKIMSKMDIAEKRLPQDGRIKLNLMNKEVDFRVSALPSIYGESIVLRILDKTSLLKGLPEIGFFPDDEKTFEKLLMTPHGIILVTGPTGSGKTTTLYAALNYINRPDRKLITIEDPVEYQLRGINQVQVHDKVGMTFAGALRACLRQAPDIIMVGEIRDFETGSIAVQAALTGHLVFSTLHTNDAPRAITRLVDMGVKPYLISSSVRAILAQRLVRTICDICKEQYTPSDIELKAIGVKKEDRGKISFFRGIGCKKCGNTGYRGRVAIFEILIVSEEIQEMIFKRSSATAIRDVAIREGMNTLRTDGIRKILSGQTTIEEVFRVTAQETD